MAARATVVCDVGIAGDEAAIAVVGPLTAAHVDDLVDAVEAVLGEAVEVLEIDLVPCDVVDRSGARALADVAEACRSMGVRCTVVGADRFVRHLVAGLGLDVPLV